MKVKLVSCEKVKAICHQNWNYGKEVDGYDVKFERYDKKKYILHFVEAGPNFSGVMLDGKKYLLDGYTQIGFRKATHPKQLLKEMTAITEKMINDDCK